MKTLLTQRQRCTLRVSALVIVATTLGSLAGCAALVGGAVVGGTMVALDRRTAGAQVDDQSIEFKAFDRIRGTGTLGRVSATSYNRMLLLTGEVPSEADRAKVEAAVQGIENLRNVVNELAVEPNASFSTRSNDTYLTGKVKTTLFEAPALQATTIKVVTERGIVYLMGRVTEREAANAALLASRVGGVQKVVRVFEIISEDELAGIERQAAKK